MLPIKNRLKKREDFSLIFSKGSYAAQGGLSAKYLKNNLEVSRIGFPVGKNYSKKAVIRNRTRRILREVCRKFVLNLKPGFDIIIMISPSYKDISFEKVRTDLEKLFQKANLLI